MLFCHARELGCQTSAEHDQVPQQINMSMEHDAIIVESEGHTGHAHARIAASGFNDLDIQGEGKRRPREA